MIEDFRTPIESILAVFSKVKDAPLAVRVFAPVRESGGGSQELAQTLFFGDKSYLRAATRLRDVILTIVQSKLRDGGFPEDEINNGVMVIEQLRGTIGGEISTEDIEAKLNKMAEDLQNSRRINIQQYDSDQESLNEINTAKIDL